MRKEAEKEMVVKVYPDEQGLWGMMVELQKVVKLNPNEELARSKTEPWFKPKIGSVIPAKRRLVKRMMFDYILHIFLS